MKKYKASGYSIFGYNQLITDDLDVAIDKAFNWSMDNIDCDFAVEQLDVENNKSIVLMKFRNGGAVA